MGHGSRGSWVMVTQVTGEFTDESDGSWVIKCSQLSALMWQADGHKSAVALACSATRGKNGESTSSDSLWSSRAYLALFVFQAATTITYLVFAYWQKLQSEQKVGSLNEPVGDRGKRMWSKRSLTRQNLPDTCTNGTYNMRLTKYCWGDVKIRSINRNVYTARCQLLAGE